MSAIDKQTTLLTPNRRLAATLHKLYQTDQTNQDNTCWETPDILPSISWITRLWMNYVSTTFEALPRLLTASQQQILWESILRQSKENPLLLQVTETANTAQSAWNLLKQWRIDLNHPSLTTTEDYASMQKWAISFQSICEQRHWIDQASLPDHLTIAIHQNLIALPHKIILAGFTDVSPQMEALLDACRKQGCDVQHYLPKQSDTKITQRCQLLDRKSEILTLARWAKATLNQHPNASIGCVIPTLDEVRDEAAQLFSEVFKDEMSFNLSAGKPLSHYPVIQAALLLFELAKPTLPVDIFNQILATPFIGEAEQERVKRAEYDSLLRQQNVMTIKLNQQLLLSKTCPQLAKRFNAFLTELAACKVFQTHDEWIHFFSRALEALGWPGERSIHSEEYQVIQRWLSLLLEYKQFDQVSTPINIIEAIDRLNQLASKTFYQPQTPDAPVQVLGLLEAAALPFDYLWVSGMDDVAWPPAPKPNPFIPKQLQRELHMPHATGERELAFCTNMMDQFSSTSNLLIYSYAETNGNIELQPSPLIRLMPEIQLNALTLSPYQSLWDIIYQHKQIETILDTQGPQIPDNIKSVGGVNIIKNQAICPIKAFSEHRLHARDIETPVPGLRAKDRGNMIHQIMESIWLQLRDQKTLLQMSEDELKEIIDLAISSALLSDSNSRAIYLHYTQLERQRLQKLIWDWLQVEKARNNFIVSANERKAEIQLDLLTFTCKIDRIDTLENNRQLIIDYKTGKNNDYKDWFGDRPEEPQLPIYALSNPDIAAIAYAQINTTESELIGIGNNDIDIDGIKTIEDIKLAAGKTWTEQLNQWKDTLTQLANDFVKGHANVDPKDGIKSCEYCTLQPLCRIHEENPHAV